mmetsp:Transcript_91623/g.186441  ORF Transcript_91623/g.186441 Transcript_91623/m.186441 type:complete len:104 (+) Transcript_91623:2-313(+)
MKLIRGELNCAPLARILHCTNTAEQGPRSNRRPGADSPLTAAAAAWPPPAWQWPREAPKHYASAAAAPSPDPQPPERPRRRRLLGGQCLQQRQLAEAHDLLRW